MSDFSTPITVGYWSIKGLGAPLRMMVLYAGCPLNAVNYDLRPKDGGGWDGSAWFDIKPDLKAVNPLINLPYVQDGDVLVSQTNACLSYLGRRLGMWGNNPAEEIECEQLLCEAMDLRNRMIRYAYSQTSPRGGAEELLREVSGKNGILGKLDHWLKDITIEKHNGSGHFFIADRATAPDFPIWEMLQQYRAMATFHQLEDPLQDLPFLSAFSAGFGARPENSKYLTSKLNALPFNNKMAVFGATPNGHPWSDGMTYPWGNDGGMY